MPAPTPRPPSFSAHLPVDRRRPHHPRPGAGSRAPGLSADRRHRAATGFRALCAGRTIRARRAAQWRGLAKLHGSARLADQPLPPRLIGRLGKGRDEINSPVSSPDTRLAHNYPVKHPIARASHMPFVRWSKSPCGYDVGNKTRGLWLKPSVSASSSDC